MKIGILGPLELHAADGRATELRGTKQRQLLAHLLLRAPRAVPVDRLIHALWGDDLPVDPGGALRTQVSRLRATLMEAGAPDGGLTSGPAGYALSMSGIELDARRFEELLQEARRRGDARDTLGRQETLEAALGLWRGSPWEDVADDPDFLGPARSLEELRWGAREDRVATLIEVGRWAEACAEAELLVHEDPIREGPRALLMRALHRSGRSHEALEAFQEYRLRIGEELGLDPSPQLVALRRDILRHEERRQEGADEGEATGRISGAGAAVGTGVDATGELHQEIHFCRAPDGVRLAYATVGAGPPLVKAANWLNHLEFDWESPVWRRLFRELAADRTLIRYDERGSGLSERDPPTTSLEDWVRDLETVVDRCGLERFPLLGISQGCAVCIEYAARHPGRVSGMILHGGYAAGWRVSGDYPPDEVARRDASIELIRHGWGQNNAAYRQMFTLTFIPGGTHEEIEWFNELERRTVSPAGAARFMEAFAEIDVRHRLAQVQAPVLVLHSDRDQRIALERGQELAAGIPGARFMMVESANHLVLEHEPAFGPWIAEIRRFLAAEVR